MTRHLTPGEKRAQERAQAAITRAWTHVRPPAPSDKDLTAHPHITPARARQIRLEIEEKRRNDHH